MIDTGSLFLVIAGADLMDSNLSKFSYLPLVFSHGWGIKYTQQKRRKTFAGFLRLIAEGAPLMQIREPVPDVHPR